MPGARPRGAKCIIRAPRRIPSRNRDLHANELTAAAPGPTAPPDASARARGLRIQLGPPGPRAAQDEHVLAHVRFGRGTEALDGVLDIHVQLDALQGSPVSELWIADGAVQQGRTGMVRHASDSQRLFGVVELDEHAHGGIEAATALAYSIIADFQRGSAFPHLLRMWNYLDAINEGEGDAERYRRFCVGRSRGLASLNASGFPAATAIGHQHATGRVQVFWLAAKTPGTALENPRQVSAYHYPRVHGPVSPTFARATVAGDGTLLISGTASIVGHASMHDDDVAAQLDETVRNLTALRSRVPQAPQGRTLLKVYVRHPADAAAIERRLHDALPAELAATTVVYLAADICRRELLLEIEGVQASA